MKILILTSSEGMPRDFPEKVDYNETWIGLLRKKYKDSEILQTSIGGGTTYDLLGQADYLKMFHPDIVFIETGLVDCAPRTLRKGEDAILSRILGGRLKRFVSKHELFFLKTRNITFVNEIDFESNLNKLKHIFRKSQVFAIGILPINENYERFVPGIIKKRNLYDEIIKKCFNENYIDISIMPEDCIMSDYQHFTVSGHKVIYNKIICILQNRING